MATKSKRQTLRETLAKPRRRRTPADRERMGKDMRLRKRATPPPYQSVLLLLEPQDVTWLDEMVGEIKPLRRRTSRNEMIRLGIALMKDKSPEELRELLRNLD
jgi:hypothetical protein